MAENTAEIRLVTKTGPVGEIWERLGLFCLNCGGKGLWFKAGSDMLCTNCRWGFDVREAGKVTNLAGLNGKRLGALLAWEGVNG